MKWSEIKRAVEKVGISEDDEIVQIECLQTGGSKELHKITIGHVVKLTECESELHRHEADGCAI